MIQRLLRGRITYLVLGALVVILYGRALSTHPLQPGEPAPPPPTPETLEWWPKDIQPSAIVQRVAQEPRLLLAVIAVTVVSVAIWLGGLVLSVWGLVNGQVRTLWRFRSRPLPSWSLGESVRIVLLAGLVGSLMPFVRLALAAAQPEWDLDFRLWVPISMLIWALFIILTILTFAVGKGPSIGRVLGLSAVPLSSALRAGLRGYVTAFPWLLLILFIVVEAARALGVQPPIEPMHELVFGERRPGVLSLTVLLACVVGPLWEELFFRGVLYPALRRHLSRIVAMVVSATFFSLLHMSPIGFLPILGLGVLLAYLYERTGSLAGPLVVHMAHNTLLMAAAMVFRQLMPAG